MVQAFRCISALLQIITMNYHNVSCVFEASGKASPNKQGWDYSLNEAIDVYWSTPRGRAGPAALRALSPKFEIEFGTMTRRASAEGTSIRGAYVEAVQNWSGFLRTGLQRDTTIRPSQDVWNENQGSGKQRCPCQFHIFLIFFIQDSNPKSCHRSASISQQSQQIRGF